MLPEGKLYVLPEGKLYVPPNAHAWHVSEPTSREAQGREEPALGTRYIYLPTTFDGSDPGTEQKGTARKLPLLLCVV